MFCVILLIHLLIYLFLEWQSMYTWDVQRVINLIKINIHCWKKHEILSLMMKISYSKITPPRSNLWSKAEKFYFLLRFFTSLQRLSSHSTTFEIRFSETQEFFNAYITMYTRCKIRKKWHSPWNGFLFLFENLIAVEQFWGLKFLSLDLEFGALSKKCMLMLILLNIGHSNVQGQKFGKKIWMNSNPKFLTMLITAIDSHFAWTMWSVFNICTANSRYLSLLPFQFHPLTFLSTKNLKKNKMLSKYFCPRN